MTGGQMGKIVTWLVEPELLEQMFKRAHNIGVGAEMVALATDSTTGLIMCSFQVSDAVYRNLESEGHDNIDVTPDESLN